MEDRGPWAVGRGPNEAVELLVEMVRTASPSGEEGQVARVLADWAGAHGLSAEVDDAAVRIVVDSGRPGATLLFASHLDTVPAGEGWAVDPLAGVVENDVLIGRGAVDAKASVAAMASAAVQLARAGGPRAGRLIVLATYSEETRDTTMSRALARLPWRPDAAIVGEPTTLQPCIAQRGQLLLRLVWSGEQVHAGWVAAHQPCPVNAIERAARDLVRLGGLVFDRVHPLLGEVAAVPTMINAGIARNTTPPRCEAVLDVRSTPAYTHTELTAAVQGVLEHGVVEVISDRLAPAETPAGSRLLAAALAVDLEATPFASPTCSDWVFMRELDAIKLGPGDSRVSHKPNEAIGLDEVRRAAALYRAIAGEYLR